MVFARDPEAEQQAKLLLPERRIAAAARVEALHRRLLERTLDLGARVAHADVLFATTGDLERAEAMARVHVPARRLRVV